MFSAAMLDIISLFWGIEIKFIINLCTSDLFDSINGPKLDLLFVANLENEEDYKLWFHGFANPICVT